MKFKLLIIVATGFCLSCALQQEGIATFVFDYEGILTDVQEHQFDSLFRTHEKKTSNEIILVTTPTYEPDSDIVSYSLNFFNRNKIGKKDLDNGVVIVLSQINKETRITTGHGTEVVLQDHIAKKIIDSLMIPQFKADKVFEGLWLGSKAIVHFLELPENKIVPKK
jgi:uncharacterized protein